MLSFTKLSSLAFGVLAIFISPASATQSLVSHQVTYQLALGEATPQTAIETITGKTVFRMVRECDGWKSGEDYVMRMGFADGNEVLMASLFESYEDRAGELFSFSINERSNYDNPLDFDGFAQQGAGENAKAYFSIEPDNAMILPEDTYFPIAQTAEILRSAKAGERFFTSHIFFGAKPDDALKKTSVIIGKRQMAEAYDISSDLLQDAYYPVQIAYFDPDSTNGIPSYEISFKMQDNGVVPSYVIDYGDFKLRAQMSQIKKEPSPTCG